MWGNLFFSEQFRKLINRYGRIGYNPYIKVSINFLSPTLATDCMPSYEPSHG